MTVVQPGSACFADLVGRRWALTLSAAALALGALLAAVARNYATIITGRSLQGIGVGGVYTITEIIITDLVPLRLRGIWFAFLSVFSAIGLCSGPILSGVLTKTASWVRAY
jgi:MFS family permease